eukprot:NODE_183_length_13752_cov_1.079103.p1 type:complete len:421 gc:universal NODE_183_length_13752_cov_1.079103:12163-13425(+)
MAILKIKECRRSRFNYFSNQLKMGILFFETMFKRCLSLQHQNKDMFQFTHDFCKKYLTPQLVTQMDQNNKADPTLIKHLFQNGFMSLEIPSDYQGQSLSFTSAITAIDVFAQYCPSIAVMVDVQNTLVIPIFNKFGSDKVKNEFLPLLATKSLGAFGLSEPSSGSDAFSLKSTAKKHKDYYILNGTKCWITNGSEADIFLVFANQDPSKGYKGISCFAVHKNQGIQVLKKEDKLGIRASSTAVLAFDDIKIPSHQLIGKEGDGYKYAIQTLNAGRIGIAAQMIGIGYGALQHSMQYTLDRSQFNTKISDFQGMQFQMADLFSEYLQIAQLTYLGAHCYEQGEDIQLMGAVCKLKSCQMAEKLASQGIEMMGGVGFTKDYPLEKFYRDAKIGAIYEGTSHIQRQTIAKMLLGNLKKNGTLF